MKATWNLLKCQFDLFSSILVIYSIFYNFRVLWVQLATLPELMVATQLADLLLSRLVLLEPSAQHNLLPWLLAVRLENSELGNF
jgi:hypothetical protein